MNPFSFLPQESEEYSVENPKQLKKAKKKLKKKNLDPKERKKWEILINEYENKGKVMKVSEKKVVMCVEFNDNKLIKNAIKRKHITQNEIKRDKNKEIKRINIKRNEDMRIKKRNNIVKDILTQNKKKNKLILLNNSESQTIKWKPSLNPLFPLHFKVTFFTIMCIHNRMETVLSILPKEVLMYILENKFDYYSLNEEIFLNSEIIQSYCKF